MKRQIYPIVARSTAKKFPRVAAMICVKRTVEAWRRRNGIKVETRPDIKWWLYEDEEEDPPFQPESDGKMVIATDLARELGLFPSTVSAWGHRGCVRGELRLTVTSDRANGRLLWWLDEEDARTYAAMSLQEKMREKRHQPAVRLQGR